MGNPATPVSSGFLPDVCSIPILAAYSGLSEEALHALVDSGELPAREIEGQLLTTRRAFLDLLESSNPDRVGGALYVLPENNGEPDRPDPESSSPSDGGSIENKTSRPT